MADLIAADTNSEWSGLDSGYGVYSGQKCKSDPHSCVAYPITIVDGDYVGLSMDLDSTPSTLEFFVNGVSSEVAFNITVGTYITSVGDGSSSNQNIVTMNFGQNSFNGSVPTGFTAGLGILS